MPKPVLSDSLFNADDVATAVLAEANLQVTNSDLGVTDITSDFSLHSNFSAQNNTDRVYKFNNFVFYNLSCRSTSTPSNNDVVWNISVASRPNQDYQTNTITLEGDYANFIDIKTNGTIVIRNPVQPSGSDSVFRIYINGWYRI